MSLKCRKRWERRWKEVQVIIAHILKLQVQLYCENLKYMIKKKIQCVCIYTVYLKFSPSSVWGEDRSNVCLAQGFLLFFKVFFDVCQFFKLFIEVVTILLALHFGFLAARHAGSWFPDQGLSSCPPHWMLHIPNQQIPKFSWIFVSLFFSPVLQS